MSACVQSARTISEEEGKKKKKKKSGQRRGMENADGVESRAR